MTRVAEKGATHVQSSYFTPFTSVSTVDFEQEKVSWVVLYITVISPYPSYILPI